MINTKRLIDTFCSIVQIDSESGNEEEFAKFMVKFGKELNLSTKMDSHKNVYIDFPGSLGDPLMFHAHMDTVVPGKNIKPVIEDGYVRSDGTTVLGADDKAAIACLMEVCQTLKDSNQPHRPFQITLSCSEESGFPTAIYIESDIKECIVIDRGSPVGEIVTKAPYAQVFEVTVTGKAVYATTSFDEGKHAILAACNVITQIPLGNFAKDATSNVGLIKGGTITTLVPEKCVFKGNCYAFNQKDLEYFFNELNKTIKRVDKQFGTSTTVEMLEYFKGFELDINDPLVKQAEKAIAAADIKPLYKTYKTVTNANNLNDIGIKSVLISYGAENQHKINERISIESLEKLANIILNAVTSVI